MMDAAETLVPKSVASCGSIGSTQRRDMPDTNAPMARRAMASRVPEPAFGPAFDALGRKSLNVPVPGGLRIEQPVVQAVGASLPELDLVRRHAVATPVRR